MRATYVVASLIGQIPQFEDFDNLAAAEERAAEVSGGVFQVVGMRPDRAIPEFLWLSGCYEPDEEEKALFRARMEATQPGITKDWP